MENYDPQFAARTRAGDVIVGGFNFGMGSSREQAVTCLKAKGIPLVIAASFSQTFLRNAYNNGFLCIEVPALVKRLREQFAAEIAGQREDDHSGRDSLEHRFQSPACLSRGVGENRSLSRRSRRRAAGAGDCWRRRKCEMVAKKLGLRTKVKHERSRAARCQVGMLRLRSA